MFGSRRGLVALLAVGVLVVSAGCSGNGKPVATATRTVQPAGPTLLTFSVYGAPQMITAYAKIAADFSAAHPDIVVNIRPYDTHAAAQKALASEIAGGQAPDAFMADVTDLPDLIAHRSVRRLDELLGERHVDFGDGYQRNALEAFSAENALQCMPVDVSPMVVYYNTSLINLAALTPPGNRPVTADTGWNFDEFAAAAAQVRGHRARGVYVEPSLTQIAPFLFSGGGHLVDNLGAPKTLQLSQGSSESAVERLLEVVRNPQLTFSKKQIAHQSAVQRFKAGKLGMILGYRSLTPVLREQQNLDFDVMPMPKLGTKATVGTSTGLCLSSATPHPQKAADFLAYAVSDTAASELAETGYAEPTNLDVENSDDFLQPGQLPVSSSVFQSSVRSIYAFPSVPAWAQVLTATAPLLSDLFYDTVIDPLDDRLKAIDAASVPIFTPVLPPTPGATGSPTPGSTPTS
ncbi:MAG: hypothetical protein JWP74_297 [Marmoricola sp.]|nr:hypothetical protein [Marmoricola sp.]